MAVATPREVGPYRVERELGSGGWSTVYEVSDGGGRRWALKRLREGLRGEAVARFRREVELMARLEHPGVVRLVDAGLDGDVPYLVTPVLEGVTVRELLADGAVPPELACAVVAAAARAVAALHAAGLVHRDLKPENLIVTTGGEVVVIDLGLALAPASTRYTAEDALTGSVPYMAPEQIDAREPSAASDVWALAVIVYEACAGRRPFARSRGSEEVAAILAGAVAPLVDLAPAVSDGLAELVARGLAAEPSARPRADELAARLEGELAVAGVASRGVLGGWLVDAASVRAELAAAAVARAVRAAEVALARGERFVAAREAERGLARCGDEPRLLALQARALAAGSAGPAPLEARVTEEPETTAPLALSPSTPASPSGRPTLRTGYGAERRSRRAPASSDARGERGRGRRRVVAGLVVAAAVVTGVVVWQVRGREAAAPAPPEVPAVAIDPPGTGVTRPAHVEPSRPAHVVPTRPAAEASP